MRSRAIRLTSGTIACLAIGGAAFFVFQSEKHIHQQISALRAFEQRAREAETTLADLRTAQQAYVAEGQGQAFWMPKVATLTESATGAIVAMKEMPIGAQARASLADAASTIDDFTKVDKRAREYLKEGQQLMAGDVIFTEGGESAATAGRQIETARLAEQQAYDASEAAIRNQEMLAAGGAGIISLLALVLLIPLPRESDEPSALTIAPPVVAPPIAATRAPASVVAAAPEPVQTAPRRDLFALKATADLATEFGRVRELDDLERLLGRAAELMDATGLVVWVGTAAGANLRPVLAHGYSQQTVARMPMVPRNGDNAAAAAYRTGTLQIVGSRPGSAAGAIVAPILAADGCIGALSAEIRSGGEKSERVQALATIVAAHLAGVLQATPEETPESAAPIVNINSR
jgi:hypothetical protein